MTRPPTALVIFDCDGVLVDSEPIALRVLVAMLAEAGVPLDAAAASDRFLGRSLASTRALLADEFGLTLTDAALEDMRRELYAAFRAELAPIPGVAETLHASPCPSASPPPPRPSGSASRSTVTGLLPAFEGRDLLRHRGRQRQARARPLPARRRPHGRRSRRLPRRRGQPGRGRGRPRPPAMRVVGFLGGGHAGAPVPSRGACAPRAGRHDRRHARPARTALIR